MIVILKCRPSVIYRRLLMRSRIVLTLIALSLAAALAGCGGSDVAGSDTKVAAAFYPLAFIAEQVAPGADVRNITPAGAEPHDLELSARDVETVNESDLVLFLGSGFQPALEQAVGDHENAVDLLEGENLMEGSEESESGLDPHVWLDPMRFAAMATRVAEAIGRPQAADDLVADLEELDQEFRDGLADCKRRTIVTSHAAFGYLAKAYGLEQIALTGLAPEAEPTAQDLEGLVSKVEAEGATTVFFETLVSPKLAETVAREAGAKTAVLNPIEGLSDDEIDDGADYFSTMRANLDALRRGLGCS